MDLRLLESVHGSFGVLAAAALLHPALLLWRGRPMTRRTRWSVGLTLGLVATAFTFGLSIYASYRYQVRRHLFAFHPTVGLLFETKEHLAYATLALALGAGVAAFAAPPRAVALRRAAARVFAAAALVCLTVAALGTYVASVRGFPNP